MAAWRRLLDLVRRLKDDRRGNVITTFALAVPVIAILALGGIDLASVSADKQKIQDVADSAVLLAAKQMTLANNSGLAERTKATIEEQLGPLGGRITYTTAVTLSPEEGLVTVQIDANRQSFFMNLLPPGGWNFVIEAKAQQMGTTPLCVLSFGTGGSELANLRDQAQLKAPGCLVHSNSDVKIEGSASLSAGVVQASGLATGTISPAPQTDAPAIADPFASMTITPPGANCSPTDLLAVAAPVVLLPGVHCGNIIAVGSVPITLLPGEHYFQRGRLELKQYSSIYGENVVLIFGKDAKFIFRDSSKINLKGRIQGNYAGFVMATTRDNTNTFEISSSAARELLGTVYIPSAELLVQGQNPVADQSAWTVIVSKSLKLQQSPDLVINKNYSGTNVPVPDGVGPVSAANVRLTN